MSSIERVNLKGKSRISLVFLAFLMCTTIVYSLPFGLVQASTDVGSAITSNTIWTKANSPYSLIGPVGVVAGVTLTIEPGVVVNLGGYYIQVNGTLTARGTPSDKIFINGGSAGINYQAITFNPQSSSWNEQTQTGCIIENAILNATYITAGGCKLNNDYIAGQIVAGTAPITNNILQQTETGHGPLITVSGTSPAITNNTITAYVAATLYGDCSTVFANNTVKAWMDAPNGVVTGSSGKVVISGNAISGFTQTSAAGIAVSSGTADTVTIENNLITGNSYGVFCSTSSNYGVSSPSGATIRNNTIVNNRVGIAAPILPSTITGNNILNSSQYSVSGNAGNVSMPNNWWGTTDQQAIAQTIYDGHRDFNLGYVNFTPVLTAPNPAAPIFSGQTTPPTTTPTPPPTPTPTCSILVTHVGSGTLSPVDGTRSYPKGSTLTLSASSAANYSFMCWLQNGVLLSESNPYNYTVVSDATITAVFYDPIAKETPTSQPTSTATPAPSPSPDPVTIPEFPTLTVIFAAVATAIFAFAFHKKKSVKNSASSFSNKN